jgi:signal transduction histidine kinase
VVMSTTMRVQLRTRIGPALVVRAGRDEPSASPVALQVHAHLILGADARRIAGGYVRLMQPARVVQRDVRVSVWDFAVAGAMVAVAMVALLTRMDVQPIDVHRFEADTWWSWAVTIVVCASLIGRRRWPLRTLAVGLVLVLPLELGGHRDSIAFFAVVIALASVAAYLPTRRAWRGVAMVAGLYAALMVGGATLLVAAPAVGPVLLAAGFALGRMLRRGQARQELEVEAAIERGAGAVETADLEAAEERLRMAQELHDVVAHSLSVIAVQAGIGVHLIDREPAQAALALEAIRTTGHTAAGELARLVQAMRGGVSADAGDAPALTDVGVLIEQIRTAGVPITFTTTGALEDVPAGVSLAAYRIVQEALTNVVRHAGRAQANVTVSVTDDHVELCIDDDGRGTTTALDPRSPGSGQGLLGMAERAQMYGGDARSGPRPGGGFRVHATLPYFASPITNDSAATPAVDRAVAARATPTRPRLPPRLWDLGLAGLVAAVAAIELLGADPTIAPHYNPTNLWTWLLKLGCGLALAARRRYPTGTFAAIWIMSLLLNVGGYKVGIIVFALDISLFTVARYATARRAVGAVIATYALLAIIASSEPREVTAAAAAWICILFTAVATAGHVAGRDRQRRTNDLAVRESTADAHARRALLAITTQRLRIADELSTIITRSIHTIAQEAETGSHMVETDPAATRSTLELISTISRDALNDLRRLLKRIRTDSEPAAYSPIPPILHPVTAGEVQ